MDPVVDPTPAAEAPPSPAAASPTDDVAPSGSVAASDAAGPAPAPAAQPVDIPSSTAHLSFTPPADVAARVARARAAQAGWAARSVEERVRILAPVRDRVLDRAEAIGFGIYRETGKPEAEAIHAEVLASADLVDYWTRSIEDLVGGTEVEFDRRSQAGKRGWVFREPRGTVGLITPWSYPVAIPLRTLVPALLAGNAVVWKPSEVAPGSATMVTELFAGLLPEGVLEVVQGGAEVGQALAEADVDLVVFVGRVENGRRVAKACAERVSPCSLALGGKDAAIVLADAALERAANGVVWGALTNAGQSCGSVERVYVQAAVAEAFIERVRAEVAALRPGQDVGPMTTERQRATVAAQVAAAAAAGGKVIQGGPTHERFIPPIVVRLESDDSPLMQEQTFGPVIPIAVVADAEEAVRRVNASRFGLTASIWSRNTEQAERLALRLRAGIVTINHHGCAAGLPYAPWCGQGESGYGVTGSPFALETLTRPRFVLTETRRAARDRWWYPYTPALRQIVLSLALLRSGTTGWLRKVKAWFRLVGGLRKRFAK
jgi:acyl-CoA reductase-like NAD-dependent aldehyde dehydrogenase